MKRIIYLSFILPLLAQSQEKKILDHSAYDIWRSVDEAIISNNGDYVAFVTEPNGIGNKELRLKMIDGTSLLDYSRSSSPSFTNNSNFLIFNITTDLHELRGLKRTKTKKEDLPLDTLGVFDLKTKELSKIANLKSFKVPKEWDDYVIYTYDPPEDSTSNEKPKKRSEKNGYDLVVMNLVDQTKVVFPYVLDFELSEDEPGIALTTTGNDSTLLQGVYVFDFESGVFEPVFRSKGEYYQLSWSKDGQQFSFISDLDTTKAIERNYHLHYWNSEMDSSKTIVSNAKLDNLIVNKDHKNYFSESGKRLFFQVQPPPIVQDTSLLEEEIVNVEVWNYLDSRLHTHQKKEKKEDDKKGYLAYYSSSTDQFVQLGGSNFSEIEVSDQGDGSTVIGEDDFAYRKLISWEGFPIKRDVYLLDVEDGSSQKVASAVKGDAQLSPKGKYIYWYHNGDSAWFSYSISNKKTVQLTTNDQVAFYNEIHDTPSDPWPYGVMSWTENDERVLIYDRYDIWEIDPEGEQPPVKITNGRDKKLKYRYVKLDPEERFITKNQKLLLTGFYEGNKNEALFSFTYGSNKSRVLISGNYRYTDFVKARDGKELIYTQENFSTFPDILSSDLSFKTPLKISDINPQQAKYKWGTSELVYWTSTDGQSLEGMLFKPEDFDPSKKYPLLVNFYEKSSDRLNRHRAPYPHRSTINYSYFTSRGYVIFNPNVHYRDGYPGESAYNCVIPGITSLIEKGFIDKENIGVQGHSWGGYQVAYLITKTDMFKCAESGAPVVNMISAYGGIRWRTGLSRMFQYERTQSRIGGSLWEYPLRYLENSPIFFSDKVNTPVLIMHNDKDGAVPWYQGIEYFVSLRRLNKPAWLLNYQGEPHWPVKVQNRIDFNIRMSQFFDHYLKRSPMPKWMRDGVSAQETGINQGYELSENE